MRITEAAQRLGTSPRMLRYRDMLGLLPPVRAAAPARSRAEAAPGRSRVEAFPGQSQTSDGLSRAEAPSGLSRPEAAPGPGRASGGLSRAHRRFADDDLAAVAHALRIEQRYDISPAALAFGLKVLTDPGVRAEVAELGRRIGRITPPPARALDFEQERALRLLRLPPGGTSRTRRD
jgi:MerR family transcriptional regulator, copper efflux regulator